MARIKDLNSALPAENDAFAFDGANGTKRISYAEFKQKLIDDGFGSGSSEAVVLTQAEYDALPDDVKDSDTIFFISDAPFESSNVVPLTQAEYNALSDATKSDGRFYYVTDEEEVAKSLVVQTNVNSAETVPSSAVVYSGLKALNDSFIAYSVTNILPYITTAFPNITGERAVIIQVGNIGIINLKLKASASFEDGVATLPSTIHGTKTVVNGALSGLHGQCGFAEYSGHDLRIRITRTADAFIDGQLVFPIA